MRDFLRQFKGKDHGPVAQFIKYGIGGVLATVVHVSVFYALAGFLLRALTADDPAVQYLGFPAVELDDHVRARITALDNFIAFIFSNMVAYAVNIYWVFEGGRHRRSVEIALFYAVSGTSIAVGTAIAWFLIHAFGLTTTVAFAANVFASVMINYAMRKFVIFKG